MLAAGCHFLVSAPAVTHGLPLPIGQPTVVCLAQTNATHTEQHVTTHLVGLLGLKLFLGEGVVPHLGVRGRCCCAELRLARLKPLLGYWGQPGNLALQVVTVEVTVGVMD